MKDFFQFFLQKPLDLKGPDFLFYYFCVAVAAYVLALLLTRAREYARPVPKLNLTDPYEIAYLRDGPKEAIRVAIVSLVDRGLLNPTGSMVKIAGSSAIEQARRPIEKNILAMCRSATHTDTLLGAGPEADVRSIYEGLLGSHGLVADEKAKQLRAAICLPVSALLALFAGTKVFVAVSRGRTNVEFLVVMAALACMAVYKLINGHRTMLGTSVLADLRTMFQGLKSRQRNVRANSGTNEAALLMALYGIDSLPKTVGAGFTYVPALFPAPKQAPGSGSSNSGCGSSCSSCGSSCGGGGGGCGGCGS